MKIIGSAPTKIILIGEHFVVYGAPAIAIPVEKRNKIILTSKKGEGKIIFKSDLGKAVYFKGKLSGKKDFQPFLPVINYVLRGKRLKENLEIKIVPTGVPKGMGSSASLGIITGIIFSVYLKRKYDQKELFQFGQLFDEIAHGGKPSGIDAMTISRGKPQKFQKSFSPLKFHFQDFKIELPQNISLIVVDTFKKKKETTASLIERFAKANAINKKPEQLKEKERKKLLKKYLIIYKEFLKNCRKNGDGKKLGEIFNKNHYLLKSVSTPTIEKLRKFVLKREALGAKLSGAGGEGGAVIVLVPRERKELLLEDLKKKNYPAFSVEIAKKGAIIEEVER